MSPSERRVTVPPERLFGYYPGTVAVVTTAHGARRTVMAAGWHAAVSSEPPLYGVAIGRERFTHELLVKSGAFAVHFLGFDHAPAVAGVGTLSGRDLDKFARFGLATEPGTVLDVPVLAAAYLVYECRVAHRLPAGDHDWTIGEVVALHHRPDAYDGRGLLDPGTARPFVYYGRNRYQPFGEAPVTTVRIAR